VLGWAVGVSLVLAVLDFASGTSLTWGMLGLRKLDFLGRGGGDHLRHRQGFDFEDLRGSRSRRLFTISSFGSGRAVAEAPSLLRVKSKTITSTASLRLTSSRML
jgi:hypothetical protein